MQILKLPGRTAKRHARAWQGYGHGLICPAPAISTRFLILAGGRRGSHLLMDLLRSHSDIHMDGEILQSNAVPSLLFPRLYLRGLRARSRSPVYGFKVSLGHLMYHGIDPQRYLREFVESNGRLIYLHRRNFFRAAVSREIAHLRGIHHDSIANPLSGLTFSIDCRKILEQIERRASRRQEECEILRDIGHLALTYEDDLLHSENQQATGDRTFQFLGCDCKPVTTSLVKRSPADLSEIVSNYDELQAAVERAGWSHFLTDRDYASRIDRTA